MNAEETIARTLAGIPWGHVSARAKEYWLSEAKKVIAALTEAGFNLTDEWEYGRDRGSHIEEDDYSSKRTTHRRRAAGPWMSVGGEA